MKRVDLVRRLLRGSSEIDRMRKEINQLVGTLRGLIENSEIVGERNYKSETGIWSVNKYVGEIHVVWTPYPVGSPYKGNETTIGEEVLPMEDVKPAYDSLGVLIDGVLKDFPALSRLWQPLLDVADRAMYYLPATICRVFAPNVGGEMGKMRYEAIFEGRMYHLGYEPQEDGEDQITAAREKIFERIGKWEDIPTIETNLLIHEAERIRSFGPPPARI